MVAISYELVHCDLHVMYNFLKTESMKVHL